MPAMIIDGQRIDLSGLLERLTLNEIFEVKSRTGMSVPQIIEALSAESIERADESFIRAYQTVVWVAHKRAGKPISFQDAGDIPLPDIAIVTDDESHPKAPAENSATVIPKATKKKRPTPTASAQGDDHDATAA